MTARAAWIDAMGTDPCYIEAEYDEAARRVLVTVDTLATMSAALRSSGLFDAATTEEAVRALEASPRVGELVDVTEAGGGWDYWLDDRVEEPAPLAAPSAAPLQSEP